MSQYAMTPDLDVRSISPQVLKVSLYDLRVFQQGFYVVQAREM